MAEFKCPKCGKSFFGNEVFKKHILSNHGEVCDVVDLLSCTEAIKEIGIRIERDSQFSWGILFSANDGMRRKIIEIAHPHNLEYALKKSVIRSVNSPGKTRTNIFLN